MVRLLKDRTGVEGELFLRAGKYDLIRDVPGLGWLVYSSYNHKYPKCTIIKHEDGICE